MGPLSRGRSKMRGALGLMMPSRLLPQVTVALLGGTTLMTMRTVGAVVGGSFWTLTCAGGELAAPGAADGVRPAAPACAEASGAGALWARATVKITPAR